MGRFSETHLTNSDSFSHTDYVTYRLYREDDGKGGGVAIIVKRGIQHVLLPCPDTKIIEAISVQIISGCEKLNVISAYFPPSKGREDIILFEKDLRLLTSGPNSLIGGDLNARHNSWNCSRGNTAGNSLFRITQEDDLLIHFPSDPTHFPHSNAAPSTLDLAVTKGVYRLDDIFTDESLASDHVTVRFTVNFGECREALSEEFVKDYLKANWIGFRNFIDREVPEAKQEIFSRPVTAEKSQEENLHANA